MPGPVIRPQALPAGEPAGWHRPGWRWILPGLILVVAATGAQRHSGLPSGITPAAGTGTARVIRTELVTSQPVSGAIGNGATTTVVAPASTTSL